MAAIQSSINYNIPPTATNILSRLHQPFPVSANCLLPPRSLIHDHRWWNWKQRRAVTAVPTASLAGSQQVGRRAMEFAAYQLDIETQLLQQQELELAVSPRSAGFAELEEACKKGHNVVPMFKKILSDQFTPPSAYRCLVDDEDEQVRSSSFLLESVENSSDGGIRMGRYSLLGAHPDMEIVAKANLVTIFHTQRDGSRTESSMIVEDPMTVPSTLSSQWRPAPAPIEGLQDVFCGGWVGFFSYDTVRYVEKRKLGFEMAPVDDRDLPDVHLGLYKDVIVFDHVAKVMYVIHWIFIDDFTSLEEAYVHGRWRLESMVARLQRSVSMPSKLWPAAAVDGITSSSWRVQKKKNEMNDDAVKDKMNEEMMKKKDEVEQKKKNKKGAEAEEEFEEEEEEECEYNYVEAVKAVKERIKAGDVFQCVLSQRKERRTKAHPFQVYRALRHLNPSPYMAYIQARDCILVAASPEILTRVDTQGKITNRPLAGTRRRGRTVEEDVSLEEELLGDEKECAEHVMLVDLSRNDVGKVAKPGSVQVEKLMAVERYSHVMHISSTVTGELRDDLTSWDVLRAALPVGTVSGAPKVRAMELIDELEPTRRGPYGGGMGSIGFQGNMDIALTLRTIVFPTIDRTEIIQQQLDQKKKNWNSISRSRSRQSYNWVAHIQSGAGIVADSDPHKEYQECVNKAAALNRAIDMAEASFVSRPAASAMMMTQQIMYES